MPFTISLKFKLNSSTNIRFFRKVSKYSIYSRLYFLPRWTIKFGFYCISHNSFLMKQNIIKLEFKMVSPVTTAAPEHKCPWSQLVFKTSHPGAARLGRLCGNYQKINVPGWFQNVPLSCSQVGMTQVLRKSV